MVQAWAVLIVSCDQQCHTKGSAHDALLAVCRLAKAQGQVTDGLGARLDAQILVVVEGVALALDTGVLHHAARISLQTTHCTANVSVNFDNLFNGRGLEEGGCHALFDTEHDTFVGRNADCSGAELDGFERVLDLEETAFWGEGVDAPV